LYCLGHDNLSLSVLLMKEAPCFQSLHRGASAWRGLATPRTQNVLAQGQSEADSGFRLVDQHATVRGPYCQPVFLCDADALLHWNSAAEEGAWVGLKPDLQGGTRFNLLRLQFWNPVQRKRI